jgi:hypothetical protein
MERLLLMLVLHWKLKRHTVVYSWYILYHLKAAICQHKFEDIKGLIINCKSKDRQHNGQKKKDKQRSIKKHTENWRKVIQLPNLLILGESVMSGFSKKTAMLPELYIYVLICRTKRNKIETIIFKYGAFNN